MMDIDFVLFFYAKNTFKNLATFIIAFSWQLFVFQV